jgi:hypothetical protein
MALVFRLVCVACRIERGRGARKRISFRDGQLVVAGDTITVVAGTPTERACPPERVQGDAELLEALAGVTNWTRQGDVVQLVGPKPLRFRVPTN